MDRRSKSHDIEVLEDQDNGQDTGQGEGPSRREMMRKALGLSSIAAGLFGLGAIMGGCPPYPDYSDWSNGYSDWSNYWSDYPDWADSWFNAY